MSHIIPISIDGGSITIEFPNDFKEVSRDKHRKSLIFRERHPEARIKRVEITSKKECGTFTFKPVNGICQIKIFYDHPEGLTVTSKAEED